MEISEEPWSLPIIVRAERNTPLTEHDVFAATASALTRLMFEARTNHAWASRLVSWRSSNIRKVVRRARGSAWEKTLELEGVTSQHNDALVRALLPHPASKTPREVKRLQASGLELEFERRCDHSVNDSEDYRPVVLEYAFSPHVVMSPGKRLAQFAHLVQYGMEGAEHCATEPLYYDWVGTGYDLRPVSWESLVDSEFLVKDAGYTEVPAGTSTIRGRWRWAAG